MTEPRVESAVEATRRALLLGVAVSILASAAVAVLVVSTVNEATAPAWWSAWMVGGFGALTLAGGVAAIMGATAGRRVSRIAAVAFAAAVVVYPFAGFAVMDAGSSGTVPWLLTAVSAPSLAILVAGGWRWTAAFLSMWTVVIVLSRSVLGGYSLTGLANDTQALLSAVTTCAVADIALRTAVHVDRAAVRAAAAAVVEAGERARLSARSRAAAFVHDEVLAALRGVADATPGSEDAVLHQAARATASVRAHPPSSDLVARVTALAEEAGARVRAERPPGAATCSPEVTDALVAATAQALDNARRHAPGADVRVTISVEPAGGRIEVADDGPGFTPENVRANRLGLAMTVLGVPAEIPGMRAEVESAPGGGTRVRLRWAADEPPVPTSSTPPGWTVRTREGLVGAIFVVTQTAVGLAAAFQAGIGGAGVVSLAMLAILLVLTAIVGRARDGVSRLRALAIVMVLSGCVAVGISSIPAPISYGSAWFVTASAFVAVALALRDRGGVALIGGGMLLALLAADAVVRSADLQQMLGIGTRVATMVGLSVVFVAVLRRLRASAAAQAEARVGSARRAAWDAAAHAELVAHLTEVDVYARPLLEHVVRVGTVTDDDRRHARAIEGRLRDGYRAGRLHGHGIADAAMQARLRGVDVVLLDDGGSPGRAETWVPDFAAVVRVRLETAEHRVVVRVLPPGRLALAHVVADGRLTTYPAAGAGCAPTRPAGPPLTATPPAAGASPAAEASPAEASPAAGSAVPSIGVHGE
ncbi:Signal transduction histidine kinase [Microbacterium sp. RURRCA19A]|nr:ATP-binding protein [Microbacterium sp. RURRCA19A]SIS02376.1 Signal transduction histidine kinase [Microbacterium sp. RURRCA19A]